MPGTVGLQGTLYSHVGGYSQEWFLTRYSAYDSTKSFSQTEGITDGQV